VSKVVFHESLPASRRDIIAWETANSPYRLPEDYKAFLLMSNGLQLEWEASLRGVSLPIGAMCLHRLADVQPVRVDPGDTLVESSGPPTLAAQEAALPAAFELWSMDGRIALFYRGGAPQPQVWFQDLSCTWYFIANSFTDYFRCPPAATRTRTQRTAAPRRN
jgi:tubulin polyglutamylase complex subunit 2